MEAAIEFPMSTLYMVLHYIVSEEVALAPQTPFLVHSSVQHSLSRFTRVTSGLVIRTYCIMLNVFIVCVLCGL